MSRYLNLNPASTYLNFAGPDSDQVYSFWRPNAPPGFAVLGDYVTPSSVISFAERLLDIIFSVLFLVLT